MQPDHDSLWSYPSRKWTIFSYFYEKAHYLKPTWRPCGAKRNGSPPFALRFNPHCQ